VWMHAKTLHFTRKLSKNKKWLTGNCRDEWHTSQQIPMTRDNSLAAFIEDCDDFWRAPK
jgi:hypothetical protein